MKTCPIKNCSTHIKPMILMCGKHWRLVPRAIQSAVWHHFRIQRGGPAHLAACAQAIRHVESTQI